MRVGPGRTDKRVALFLVLEGGAVEECAVALIVDRAIAGYMRKDSFPLASFGLFAIGVAGIGDHVHPLRLAHGHLRRLCHRRQTASALALPSGLLHPTERV